MKLYVFQVNNGTTLTFDTELAVQTVSDLKHAIQTKYKIATQHQVLVVNGGECMVGERRVCSYSAGTDTNPIFLFNKEMILCERPPTIPKTTFSIENEMELKVEESLMMPAVFHTVASRTQLAVEMSEVAKKLRAFCEQLVHDEHLQQQGWAAIMANLDDCALSYQKLLWKFETAYNSYQQDIEDIKLKLNKLGKAVAVMARIPLLESLTRHSYRESLEKSGSPAACEGPEEERSVESVLHSGGGNVGGATVTNSSCSSNSRSPGEGQKPHEGEARQEGGGTDNCSLGTVLRETDCQEGPTMPTFNVSLLDWINVQDRPNDVESVVRKCLDSINRLDPRIIQPFLVECRDTISKLDNQNMKAIKGLEDRLYALDQMIASCNKLVNEQKELSQGFLANQMRAENLKDTSVLPDLCLSHANQLMIMLTNHRKLLDIKQKCTTAKQELANNLQVRLKWCCYVMLHADQDGEKLQALLRLLTELLERVRVVDALSTVPQMYCLAVVEVVRRKVFIRHYREWASALVKDGKQLYEAEKAKRETFGKLFRKSFLRNRLFRGLDSWPPSAFCTRKPRRFDYELPEISLADLHYLKSCCPAEVQPFLSIPTLCDFEPLQRHSHVLHQLVQATQSVDEMSQTITDLLSEQEASNSQTAQMSPSTPQSKEGAPAPPRTPSSLSLQGPLCQPLTGPGLLEELSPDSIDAHTFDFETIGHPGPDLVLPQGSLDLDSLAESPESDFLSAVNEFVIEENPPSPAPISDPTSPEMMVESLYSSVINAIDSKRIQDTHTLERENFKMAALRSRADTYRTAAEESQSCLRSIREDLHHFRGLALKEQRDFGFAMKTVSLEVRSIMDGARLQHEEELRQKVDTIQTELEGKITALREELDASQGIIGELEATLVSKKKELERAGEAAEELERKVWEVDQVLEKQRAEQERSQTELEQREQELIARNEARIRDLELRVTSLSEQRCRLEVELALKESEVEEVRLQGEEEVQELRRELHARAQDHETGLAELRALMRMEKDNCISELVERHEEEAAALRTECEQLRSGARASEHRLREREAELEIQRSSRQTESEERKQIEEQLELERRAARQAVEEAVCGLKQEKQEAEEELLQRVQLLEEQLHEALGGGAEKQATPPLGFHSEREERLQEERDSLLAQLEQLEMRMNEELQTVKTSLIAEQQTNFNTVLTREKLKKEQVINDLTEKLMKVTQQQDNDKGLIETLQEDRANLLHERKQLEEELNRLRSTTLVSSAYFAANSAPCPAPTPLECSAHEEAADTDRLAWVVPGREEERVESAVEASMMAVHENILTLSQEKQRILLLERTLHMKEEENKRLSQKLMSQSMSSVSSRHSEKIAIRDFQVGDLVLIILDERHDNYVLFTVGPTLYFLHSESLGSLDLKPASGAARRPWVLGKVMEKEYCQAKKAQNRFKVPLGTKFYRVKAVPWNKKV